MVATRSLRNSSGKPPLIVALVVSLVLGVDELSKQWALRTLRTITATWGAA
jgi:hypothetical protein